MAGVNPALTQSLLGHIQSLRDEGMTVLFVEHDMHMVRHISDWVVVMAEGRLIAEGPRRLRDGRPGGDRRLPRGPPRHRPRRRRPAQRTTLQIREEWPTRPPRRGGAEGATRRSARPSRPSSRRRTSSPGYLPGGEHPQRAAAWWPTPGEMIGIIGPNGAGKSTLLKAMFGLVKVHSGQVTLNGQDITNLKANQLVEMGVGFVPQTNNVFPSPDHRGEPPDGALHAPQEDLRAPRRDVGPLPGAARPSQPAGRRPLRR